LDARVPGFRQVLRNLWAIGAGNAQSRDQEYGSATGRAMLRPEIYGEIAQRSFGHARLFVVAASVAR